MFLFRYVFAMEISNVQYSLKTAELDHGVWARQAYWSSRVLHWYQRSNLPNQFDNVLKKKIIVQSYFSNLKDFFPANFLALYVKPQKCTDEWHFLWLFHLTFTFMVESVHNGINTTAITYFMQTSKKFEYNARHSVCMHSNIINQDAKQGKHR